MPEVYDSEFETMRLAQLSEQCSLADDLNGMVIFRSSTDHQAQAFTWVFNDTDYARLCDSSYKEMLLPLIDNLITYRLRCAEPNGLEGFVTVSNGRASITWLPDDEGEALAALHQTAA
jgi:hypothetical protein